MATPKRLKRATNGSFQKINSAQSQNNQWNRRINSRPPKLVHDDSIKLTLQGMNVSTIKEDQFYKSAKDCKDINDKYRKLMKEENELLQDLRKLQVKKQLLIKRSKQLKDEQIVKLNVDLEKEKDIRTDLGKKFASLEKKLNQLEKEVENRNKEKNGKNQVVLTKSSWLDTDDKSKEKNLKKNSKDLLINKKDYCEFGCLANKTTDRQVENLSDRVVRPKSNLIDVLNGQNSNQFNVQVKDKRTFSPRIDRLQPKIQINLAKKSNQQLPKLTLTPKLQTNSETNTELINSVASASLEQPKTQQTLQSELNNAIRVIFNQQGKSITTNAIVTAQATPTRETSIGQVQDSVSVGETNQQMSSGLNNAPTSDSNAFEQIESSQTTTSNASSTLTNEQRSEQSSIDSTEAQSPSSINVNLSASSSDNISF